MVIISETLARRVTIAVIGLGEMGTIHARNLSRNPHVRLALASQRKSRLDELGKELGSDIRFTSYDEVFNSDDIDGIVVATPFDKHVEYVKRGLMSGKKVLVEKPLGVDSTEVRGLADAIHGIEGGAGLGLMVGFQRRWDNGYSEAFRAVKKGALGELGVIKATSGDSEYPEKYWRGGGSDSLLRDLAVHDIDLARWLFGKEVARVYVVGRRLVYGGLAKMNDWDTAVATLEMKGGGVYSVHFSRCLNYGHNVSGELICGKGTLRIDDAGATDVQYWVSGHKSVKFSMDFAERFREAFTNEADAFVHLVQTKGKEELKKLRAGDARYAGYDDGLKSALVADALVESLYSGSPAEVEYGKPEEGKAGANKAQTI
eukprot:Plantae.Rhodophyta-Hildenbrandia_rubra.ctg7730.p1 GENE.Plantae.Rhodophyta-Hildenbrandia_rubra.ctg7730~~Plantae.Rhodophyta-Hildenbrandia_rubra.ctg7730.p1  ORF type:complete len:373 (+),score=57.83 Plantae.Rhodophyta-Hildenbrandia_rubra.ctg7730:931-2049(+)